jgi:hypothetical protein
VTDELLEEPPLGVRFSDEEAQTLVEDTLGAAGAFAATDFGVDGRSKDKGSNQDFAMAATIRVRGRSGDEEAYQFGAVADGVTSRTLWPERAARIAVLVAWRVARRYVQRHPTFAHDEFEKFTRELTEDINRALENDMTLLLSAGAVPPGWAPETYRQFMVRRELWYNSTLLVALLGANGGFAASCGDGGFVVRKRENGTEKSVVLVGSTDNLTVSGVVSLAADAMQFRKSRIAMSTNTNVEILITSDGVDRSLRRNRGEEVEQLDPYDVISAKDSKELLAWMTGTLREIPDREVDNISTAILHWPPPATPPLPPVTYLEPIVPPGKTTLQINREAEARFERPQDPNHGSLNDAVTTKSVDPADSGTRSVSDASSHPPSLPGGLDSVVERIETIANQLNEAASGHNFNPFPARPANDENRSTTKAVSAAMSVTEGKGTRLDVDTIRLAVSAIFERTNRMAQLVKGESRYFIESFATSMWMSLTKDCRRRLLYLSYSRSWSDLRNFSPICISAIYLKGQLSDDIRRSSGVMKEIVDVLNSLSISPGGRAFRLDFDDVEDTVAFPNLIHKAIENGEISERVEQAHRDILIRCRTLGQNEKP